MKGEHRRGDERGERNNKEWNNVAEWSPHF